jgi:uncharacterized protein YndB with AHSA1/START domain
VKFKIELLIGKPRQAVWEFFTDPEKTKLWQPTLIKIDPIYGIMGQPDSESKWTYQENRREFSLTEKVLSCEEPSHFESQFENEFAKNVVRNLFIEQSKDQTLWVAETTYMFKTLLMKILGPILRKNYMARSQKEMERFKETIEKSNERYATGYL